MFMRFTRLTMSVGLVLVGCLMPLCVRPAGAELDAAAALNGRWEGKTEVTSPRLPSTRFLVITNARQESTADGIVKWKADGRYGITADKLGRVDVTITVVEPTVTVEFLTPESLHVTLKLLKANVLEGTHVTSGGRAHRMHLERSE
jgi:hypothetical protein